MGYKFTKNPERHNMWYHGGFLYPLMELVSPPSGEGIVFNRDYLGCRGCLGDSLMPHEVKVQRVKYSEGVEMVVNWTLGNNEVS